MDKPELIVPVIIGDGEAETGPTAASVDSSLQTDHELTQSLQRLACRQVHRSEGVWSCSANRPCERFQD